MAWPSCGASAGGARLATAIASHSGVSTTSPHRRGRQGCGDLVAIGATRRPREPLRLRRLDDEGELVDACWRRARARVRRVPLRLRRDRRLCGNPEGPGRLDAWLLSIGRAIADAQAIAGTRHVALVGLRLGATLAVEPAAARGGGVPAGSAGVPSTPAALTCAIKAPARLCPEDNVPPAGGEDDIESAGHVVTRETAEALERLDLQALQRMPARRRFYSSTATTGLPTRCSDTPRAAGLARDPMSAEGTAAALEQPALSQVPRSVLIESLAGCVTGAYSKRRPSLAMSPRTPCHPWRPGRLSRARHTLRP